MSTDELVLVCKSFQILTAIVGLALNVYILLVIPFSRPTVYNCLLLCLAIGHTIFDLLVLAFDLSVLAQWFGLVTLTLPEWSFWSIVVCNLNTSVWALIPVCNLWIISALVVDRYLVIVKPFEYESKVTTFRCILLILFGFLFIFLCTLPFWFTPPIERIGANCLLTLNLSGTISANIQQSTSLLCIVLIVAFFFVPISIVLFCNIHLLLIIIDHRNRIRKMVFVVQQQQQQQHNSGPTTIGQLCRQRDSLTTTFNLFCTLLLMLPYIINLLGQFTLHYFDPTLSAVSLVIVTLTPLVNGYIYGIRCQPIKKAFKRVLQVRD